MPVTFLPRPKAGRSAPRSTAKSSGKAGGKTGAGRGAGASGPAGVRRKLDRLFSHRELILRLCLAAAACAAVVVVVRGWEPPMRHRLGDFAADGIAARLPFSVENRLQTERLRERNAAAVRPIFRNEPDRLDPLAARFRREFADLAAADTLAAVPRQVRAAFGLVVALPTAAGPDGGPYPVSPEAVAAAPTPAAPLGGVPTADQVRASENAFGVVRDALLSQPAAGDEGGTTSAARLDAVTAELDRLLDRLGELGLIDAAALAPAGIIPDSTVRIVQPDGRTELQLASTLTVDRLVSESNVLDPVWGGTTGLQAVRGMVEHWLVRHVPATLVYAADATAAARAEARASTPAARTEFAAGEQLVPPGAAVDADALDLLTAEHATLAARLTPTGRLLRCAAVGLMLAVVSVLLGWFLRRTGSVLTGRPVRLAVYLAGLVAAVALARWLSFDPWRAEVIPILGCAMVFTVAYDQWLGAVTAFVLAAVAVFCTTGDLDQFITLMSVCVAGVLPLATVAGRSTVIKVGLLAGLIYLATSGGLGLLERQPLGAGTDALPVLTDGLRGAAWCLLAGYLVAGSLPFIENLFGVVTDISLLEMGDVSHPLLQDLVRRAPGTYNHSISVATIGETAADAIGANGLLLRTAAYFHDVGKMLKPHYFVENQTEADRNRHSQLAPAMSTLIIIGHVKDGVDLARRHGLPERLIDFIEQHHGTTLVAYFFHEAGKRAEQTPGHEGDAEEDAFRYPGPKPQSKETGVMMLADAVESATRTLSEPTPKRIEGLVKKLAMDRLLDGQFDESSLTLAELHKVERSLVKSLIGIHHGRIKYPDQKS